jgi:hypothetical protein
MPDRENVWKVAEELFKEDPNQIVAVAKVLPQLSTAHLSELVW